MAKYRGVDIDLTPTDGMKAEAERALAWRKEGNPGGTAVGIARARQLKNKQELSARTVRRMFSFFSRHEVDKEAEGFSPGEEGYPSKGRVAWALWGGDPGFSWSRAKVRQLDRIDEEKSVHYEDDEDEKAKPISAAVKDGLKRKADEHNDKYGDNPAKRVTYGMLAKVFRRGVGAYHTNPQSVRPNVRSPEQWAYARVNSFLYAVRNGKFRSGKHDTDLLPEGHPMRGPKEDEKMYEELMGIISTEVEKVEETDNFVKIRGMASTIDVDRTGDVMKTSCWSDEGLKNYKENPIILFNHNYDKPIGRATMITPTEGGLQIEANISKADPYIAKLIDDGILSTFSVGFRVKDADVNKETGGLYIKEAELYEVSVVSVPANQAAKFEVVKCFSPVEFESYKKGLFVPDNGKKVDNTAKGKFEMDKEMKELIAKQTSAAVKMALAEKEAADKRAAEEAAKAKAAEEEARKVAVEAGMSGAERLLEEVKKSFDEGRATTQAEIDELKKALKDRSEEVAALQKSKRQFVANGTNDWKKAHESDIRDAYVLGAITQKGFNTKFGGEVMEKVNDMSGVEMPGAASTVVFENIASTAIERDIQNQLVLAPLFREIAMSSATMVMPILPDAGYAEFTTAAGAASYTGGKGNIEARGAAIGANNGVDLSQKVLTTHKLMSVTFLANDTDEDAILPLLPLLNETLVRSHARAVEHALLLGGHSTAVNTGGFDGLVEIGKDNSTNTQDTDAFASAAATTAILLGLRKNLGKYGVRPQEVVYLVSERAYFELLEDPEFQDANLVGANLATKVVGEIGNVFGSRVLLVDEFNAPAVSEFYCAAVNPRNFVIPRLRGATLESQYVPRLQHRELIATQRLGFSEVITGATAVSARNYSANAT